MKDDEDGDSHTKDRIAALTDGIYSVAMTLLVIDLKLPEAADLQTSGELAKALIGLEPKFLTWVTSFFVLALFWLGHLRSIRLLRGLDGTLVTLYLVQLGFVSLMPFSSALVGEYAPMVLSQVIYSLNMAGLSVLSLMISRHIHRHPALQRMPLSAASVSAARLRVIGLLAISIAAVPIAMVVPGGGNQAFLLMLLIVPISHRIERRGR